MASHIFATRPCNSLPVERGLPSLLQGVASFSHDDRRKKKVRGREEKQNREQRRGRKLESYWFWSKEKCENLQKLWETQVWPLHISSFSSYVLVDFECYLLIWGKYHTSMHCLLPFKRLINWILPYSSMHLFFFFKIYSEYGSVLLCCLWESCSCSLFHSPVLSPLIKTWNV